MIQVIFDEFLQLPKYLHSNSKQFNLKTRVVRTRVLKGVRPLELLGK